MVETNNKK